MDARRVGEFVFGAVVVALGVGLLSLAFGRLNGPATVLPDDASAQIAQATAAPSPRAEPAVLAAAPATVKRTIPHHRFGALRADRSRPVSHALPISRDNRLMYARTPVAVAQYAQARLQSAKHVQPHRAVAEEAPHTLAKRPPPAISRTKIARASKPQHRYGIAYVRIAPRVEPTPEPPIGYDDHPTLLRSDAPSAAMPAVQPVQVELTRTNRGR